MCAVLVMVWMTNLYNFMAGADGLVGGMTLFGLAAYGAAAWVAGNLILAAIGLAITAAAGVFLIFNFVPERIFRGNSGSIPFATSHVLDRYRDKTVVIPIGLDKSSYPTPTPELLARWRSRVGERFFLFVGMIRYYKGPLILLDAVQGTDYPVVIVGAGPVEAELKEHARRLGLRNVHFLGALLQLCYAVVFPSHLRSEAFGISLLEGAMYGKPMISSEIRTGTSYINVGGDTGLVVPPSDAAAFREAMRFLWDNPDAAAEMGRRAEQRYWDMFTAERMVASYVDLYRELLAAQTHRPVAAGTST